MDILLITLSILALILWFVGNFLPILPWPPLTYLALILIQIMNKSFSTQFLIIMAVVCIAITIIDYIIPIIWTKKMWWTKRGINWSTLWLIIWVVILPLIWIVIWPFGLIWLLAWPFLWAYIWEIAYQKYKKHKQDNKKALKSAFWSFLWFISGILIKVIYTIIVLIYISPKIFELIRNMF